MDHRRLGTGRHDTVSDEKFISELTKALSVGASPERRGVQAALAKVKVAERFLNKDDAFFLRAEFLAYFQSDQ